MNEQRTEEQIATEKALAAVEAVLHLQNEWTITVCDACLCACCWQGELMCDEADRAGTADITIAHATGLHRESPSYWTKDENVIAKLLAKGIYA